MIVLAGAPIAVTYRLSVRSHPAQIDGEVLKRDRMRHGSPHVAGVVSLALCSGSFAMGVISHRFVPGAAPGDWLAFAGSFIGSAFAVLGGAAIVEYQNRRSHSAKTHLIRVSPEQADRRLRRLAGHVAHGRSEVDLLAFGADAEAAYQAMNRLHAVQAHIPPDTIQIMEAYDLLNGVSGYPMDTIKSARVQSSMLTAAHGAMSAAGVTPPREQIGAAVARALAEAVAETSQVVERAARLIA